MFNTKLLLHICCAPCSIYCIDALRAEGIDVTGYWYNPNIHPVTEYRARLAALREYSEKIGLPVIYEDFYGLRPFAAAVSANPDDRCGYCYASRLEKTALEASKGDFDAFCTTLLVSPYQKHDLIAETAEKTAFKYSSGFLYRDFRPGFRQGQAKARELGLYMQKYCGCVFSEEERYLKPRA